MCICKTSKRKDLTRRVELSSNMALFVICFIAAFYKYIREKTKYMQNAGIRRKLQIIMIYSAWSSTFKQMFWILL